MVNYLNPGQLDLNTPGLEAVRNAKFVEDAGLRVVDVPHMVALKLYAGGIESKVDALKLIERNPDIDLDSIRRVCAEFGLEEALDDALRQQ